MFFDAKVINKQFKSLLKKIKDFDKIVIYRHEMPDFDAFGTQMGLYYWIKDNFPLKEVIMLVIHIEHLSLIFSQNHKFWMNLGMIKMNT